MKTKKSKEEIKQGAGLFYYETIGMVLLILSVIILAKLGTVGSFLTVFLKTLFGDWYLLLVALILIFGIYLILKHQSFNFKNQRFLGYVFFIIALLMLSHFSVHKYISSQGDSYFSNTWLHYKNYITNSNVETYLGGGLFGALIFYIFFALLGSFGVILVSLIFIVLGVTMIINKPIIELFKIVSTSFKKLGKMNKSFNNFFKYELGKKEETVNIYDCNKKIILKYFDEYKNVNYNYDQERKNEEFKSLINSTMNNLNLKYRLIQNFISYSCITYNYQIYDEFDCNQLISKLCSLIEENVYVSKMGNNINIEINKKNSSILSLREVLTMQPMLYNNYLMPIGMNIKNQLEEIDFSNEANILIIGDFNVGVKSFISSIIVTSIMKISVENIEFNLFDDCGDFNDFLFLFKDIQNGDIKEYLNKIINKIDERINLISLKNAHQIDEYNILISDNRKGNLKREIYIIELDDNNYYDYRFIDDKIMYIIQVGRDVGIYVIFISRNIKRVSSILFSLFKYKIVYNVGNADTSLIETKHTKVLENPGDCLFFRDNLIKRIQTPKFTKEELEKIKKEIK